MHDKKASRVKIAVIATALIFVLTSSVSVMSSTLGTRSDVIVLNASATPPVIAVNTDITELRVNVAGMNSSIDLVKIDLSPLGGNASTIMTLIGNFTEGNITGSSYNYSTNASVEGSFNLTINATDMKGNYNKSVCFLLEVKRIVIPVPTEIPAMTFISNISYDRECTNVGQNATTDFFTATEVIDNATYYVINTSKPTGGTKMYVDLGNKTVTMRRIVTEPGLADLSFDPEIVMLDFPLWAGKTWTNTTKVTGVIANETGAKITINATAVISGAVTEEVNLTVPYGTVPSLVLELNCSFDVFDQPQTHQEKYWISQEDNMILIPKSERYINGNLMEELVLIDAFAVNETAN
ncbi:hypothetical protein C5S53_12955 [Methanophagales archaeon]|nr:hypothetical protein C5S53_12955 [Methanophagales archaeon]